MATAVLDLIPLLRAMTAASAATAAAREREKAAVAALQAACDHPFVGQQRYRSSGFYGNDCNGPSGSYDPGNMICLVCGFEHEARYGAGPLYRWHHGGALVDDLGALRRLVGSRQIADALAQRARGETTAFDLPKR